MSDNFSYAVIGAGAIGSYYGIKLALAGFDTCFLARSYAQQLKKTGLVINSIEGASLILEEPAVYHDIKQMPVCDVVIIAIKGDCLPIVTAAAENIMHAQSTILILQNGK